MISGILGLKDEIESKRNALYMYFLYTIFWQMAVSRSTYKSVENKT